MTLPSDLWPRALDILALQMTRQTFDTWLRGSRVVEARDGHLVIGVPNAYALDWLNNRLMQVVQRGLTMAAGAGAGPLTVEFVVVPPADLPAQELPQDSGEPLIEAVREQHVSVAGGQALVWTDFYIKLKVAFRKRALRELKGAPLAVFICLALHVDRDGVAYPGIDTIMRETGYSRSVVCNALDSLVNLGICTKRPSFRGCDEYIVNGYAWFGQTPAPALFEVGEK